MTIAGAPGDAEEQRAGPDVVGRDLVADVEDPHLRREPEHDRLAHADELVGEAVVGRERDEHAVTLSAVPRSVPAARSMRGGARSMPQDRPWSRRPAPQGAGGLTSRPADATTPLAEPRPVARTLASHTFFSAVGEGSNILLFLLGFLAARLLGESLREALEDLESVAPDDLKRRRRAKFRSLGVYA